jgi:L-iditol 2-dehydrogenase
MVVRGEHGLGHESAGIVIKVGAGVTQFKEGPPTEKGAGFDSRRPSSY